MLLPNRTLVLLLGLCAVASAQLEGKHLGVAMSVQSGQDIALGLETPWVAGELWLRPSPWLEVDYSYGSWSQNPTQSYRMSLMRHSWQTRVYPMPDLKEGMGFPLYLGYEKNWNSLERDAQIGDLDWKSQAWVLGANWSPKPRLTLEIEGARRSESGSPDLRDTLGGSVERTWLSLLARVKVGLW